MWFFFLLWLVSFCVYFLIQDLFLLISFTDSFDHLSLKPSREHFIFCKLLPLIAALDNVSYFFFPSQWIQKDCPLLFTLQRMGSISQGGDLQHQSWACLPLPFCHITTWKASQFFFSLQNPLILCPFLLMALGSSLYVEMLPLSVVNSSFILRPWRWSNCICLHLF